MRILAVNNYYNSTNNNKHINFEAKVNGVEIADDVAKEINRMVKAFQPLVDNPDIQECTIGTSKVVNPKYMLGFNFLNLNKDISLSAIVSENKISHIHITTPTPVKGPTTHTIKSFYYYSGLKNAQNQIPCLRYAEYDTGKAKMTTESCIQAENTVPDDIAQKMKKLIEETMEAIGLKK